MPDNLTSDTNETGHPADLRDQDNPPPYILQRPESMPPCVDNCPLTPWTGEMVDWAAGHKIRNY